jgi:ABC-type phosphate transport system permease subunit
MVRPARSRRNQLRAQSAGGGHSLLAEGESQVWLTGGALVLSMAMIVGLLALIVVQGAPTFWPQPVVEIETLSGKKFAGEISRVERYAPTAQNLADELGAASDRVAQAGETAERRMIRTENFELTNSHYQWVSDFAIKSETNPAWMLVVERLEQGRFYGVPSGAVTDGEQQQLSADQAWKFYNEHHQEAREAWRERRALERDTMGRIDAQEEVARLSVRQAEITYGEASPQAKQATQALAALQQSLAPEREQLLARIKELHELGSRRQLLLTTADGVQAAIALEQIARAYAPNQLSWGGKLSLYIARWREFLTEEPRHSNTEGGVFPAIFGTIAMTLIMSLLVCPFGVLAALYLREYAKSGFVVSLIRIAINNLAGVPSIVFGVFGFGFFVYQVGAYIDGGPQNARLPVLPPPMWYVGLGALAVTAITAFATGVYGISGRAAEASTLTRTLGRIAIALWLLTTLLAFTLIATTPFFGGFFQASLPNPTFGQGGILWAALTLSLLTLPVVIVATEEALAAVPNSMREGSYACGAGKWQTIRRIVLPHAMPGIMTGMILAMSRGAGEAAPLMLVGALKFAPKLPVDLEAPFVHANRPFMHLAFHIFDLGFHSPNSEAAKPTVFTTALLLIAIVACLNIAAVWMRARLRKAFRSGQF